MGGQSIITSEYTKGSIELTPSFEGAGGINGHLCASAPGGGGGSRVDNNPGDTIPKGGRPIDGPAAAIKNI